MRTRLIVLSLAGGLLALVAAFAFTGGSTAAATAPQLREPAPPAPAVLGLDAARSGGAAATIQRTFVSTSGSDANPCTRAAPCRGFAAAIANTTAGGEVVALDSGGYGPVGIGMAVTLVGAPGVHAAISVFSGNGIEIDAGPTDTVVLRNLYVNGLGGSHGIVYDAGRGLHLEQVTVTGFTSGNGVQHQAPNGRLHAADLNVHGNSTGVLVAPETGLAPVSLDRVEARENSNTAIFGFRNARLRISDCVVSGNSHGVAAFTPTMVSGCLISENDNEGFIVSNMSVGRIGGSTVTANGIGLWHVNGTLESFGDNLVRGNTNNTSGTITAVGKT